MELTNEELEEKLLELEEAYVKQSRALDDLFDYLERTDSNFATNPGSFDDWRTRLDKLRHDEQIEKELHNAKRVLKDHGYLVIADEGELDMARVKKWVSTGHDPDDDIPF